MCTSRTLSNWSRPSPHLSPAHPRRPHGQPVRPHDHVWTFGSSMVIFHLLQPRSAGHQLLPVLHPGVRRQRRDGRSLGLDPLLLAVPLRRGLRSAPHGLRVRDGMAARADRRRPDRKSTSTSARDGCSTVTVSEMTFLKAEDTPSPDVAPRGETAGAPGPGAAPAPRADPRDSWAQRPGRPRTARPTGACGSCAGAPARGWPGTWTCRTQPHRRPPGPGREDARVRHLRERPLRSCAWSA